MSGCDIKLKTSIFKEGVLESLPYTPTNLKSIRNKSLQKLAFLSYAFCSETKLRATVEERAKGCRPLVDFLKPKDIMPLIHCNYRTAQDYVYALQTVDNSV